MTIQPEINGRKLDPLLKPSFIRDYYLVAQVEMRPLAKWCLDFLSKLLLVSALRFIANKSGAWPLIGLSYVIFLLLASYLSSYFFEFVSGISVWWAYDNSRLKKVAVLIASFLIVCLLNEAVDAAINQITQAQAAQISCSHLLARP